MQASVLALGVIVILLFDVIASIASRTFGFAYVRASVGSYVIYLFIGAIAARSSANAPLFVAAVTAGIVGLVEASIGWWLSWKIGPGRPDFVLTPRRWLTVAVNVSILASV